MVRYMYLRAQVSTEYCSMAPVFRVAIGALLLGFASSGAGCVETGDAGTSRRDARRLESSVDWNREVLYHVFVRSFFDANGDGHGDLQGIRQRLDYLQDLGVTGILLTPLYPSPFYHNYFADSFEGIDVEYGTMEDYHELVRDLHARDMRLIMDMEVQYVTGAHPWYRDSFRNPSSRFSDYVRYNDDENAKPEPLIPGFLRIPMYDGTTAEIATVNFDSDSLATYLTRLFRFWVDPDADGSFDDGVDGFRLDHFMDDLDYKGQQTDLYARFWKPLFEELHELNPDLLILAEQAGWDYGTPELTEGGTNAVFAFPLAEGVRQMDGALVTAAIDTLIGEVLPRGYSVVFVENHDMNRLASELDHDPARLRAAAALNLLVEGIPMIYYGQEIGMRGTKGEWGADGNDIPMREAMDWYASATGEGMALWYEETGPWWGLRNIRPYDGLSVEEQHSDSSSLWHHYRRLIELRQTRPALRQGVMRLMEDRNPDVVTFARASGHDRVLVLVNLSASAQEVMLDETEDVFSAALWLESPCPSTSIDPYRLAPYAVAVCAAE